MNDINSMFNNLNIEKVVAEYTIWDNNFPLGKYKIKVYENISGKFIAYTNLQIADVDGTPYCGVGHGDDIQAAMKDAISNLANMYLGRNLTDKDYCYIDPVEF